jgi:molybdenum cofactor cytidylyltransferase
MLCAVDQPRPWAVIQRLIEAHASGTALITLPAHGGRRGHPVIFASSLRDELMSISEETLGIRAVLDRHQAETAEVEIDDPSVFIDINAPEDLASAGGPPQ